MTFAFSSFISRSFSLLNCSCSWNFSLLKLTDSCKSISWVVPLIWFSCVVCAISLIMFIYFSKFSKQSNKMLTAHSRDFNPSEKTSVFSETDRSFKIPSHCFLFDSPTSSVLLLKYRLLLLKKLITSRLILKSITTVLLWF